MTTLPFNRLMEGPMDEIDAAIWSGDMFVHRDNITTMRLVLAQWERGLKEAEDILNEMEKDHA